jgi:RNA recognition motif-containing protein
MASKLYVGGLSYSTTSETLREYFAQCGTVESAAVITDKFSGQSRGFGFVEMATAEEAQRAISELNGKDLDGRKLTVNLSTPKAPGSGGGGPRGGSRPGGGRPGKPPPNDKKANKDNDLGVSDELDSEVLLTDEQRKAAQQQVDVFLWLLFEFLLQKSFYLKDILPCSR